MQGEGKEGGYRQLAGWLTEQAAESGFKAPMPCRVVERAFPESGVLFLSLLCLAVLPNVPRPCPL
jgi:hypothetical protein